MNSAKIINYELRPCKYIERRMLLASFARIISAFKCKYQYIGFGGLAFTDFKLFHRELQIEEMYSIEGVCTENQLEFNKPYSCIKIVRDFSTMALSSLPLDKPSIIWLDYDGVLTTDVFEDLRIIMKAIPPGSIYVMSCNKQLRREDDVNYTEEELRNVFGTLVPNDIDKNPCTGTNDRKTIRKMLEYNCNNFIEERNRLQENLKFYPLYNFSYEEHRGARMFTYGGIVLKDDYDVNELNINDLDFLIPNMEDVYKIEMPNLTHREILELNKILYNEDEEKDFVQKGIVEQKDITKYKKVYKYMPNYYDVRI